MLSLLIISSNTVKTLVFYFILYGQIVSFVFSVGIPRRVSPVVCVWSWKEVEGGDGGQAGWWTEDIS